VVEHTVDGDRQGRRHEEAGREEIRQRQELCRVHEEDDRRERDARDDLDRLPPRDAVPRVRVADRDDERERGEDRAPDRAPARVVDDLEQKEVREQQDEQARVAVQDADDAPAREEIVSQRWLKRSDGPSFTARVIGGMLP
jgi:hypothetical protein